MVSHNCLGGGGWLSRGIISRNDTSSAQPLAMLSFLAACGCSQNAWKTIAKINIRRCSSLVLVAISIV